MMRHFKTTAPLTATARSLARSFPAAFALLVLLAAFGLTSTPAQAQTAGVRIAPGQNIQQIVNSHPAGTTFIIGAGVHRMQTITARTGDTFIGEPGAVLNGSRILDDFKREGSYWVAYNQTQENTRRVGECQTDSPRCVNPEDVFLDGRPLRHVSSQSQLRAGAYYFDYPGNRILLYDDPNGRLVETSITEYAFVANGRNVTVRDLTVEKYASLAQAGAITTGDSWVLDNITSQYNHGGGVRLGTRSRMTNSRVNWNGQIGVLSALTTDVLIEHNEIAYNNYAGYKSQWEAGGSKFARTHNLVARNNYVHHNKGTGLWTDINNYNTLYENNLAVYNDRAGIFHEISFNAIIRNNVVKFNSLTGSWRMWGSQILVANSKDVEVYGNEVVVDRNNGDGIGIIHQNRGGQDYGGWLSYNVNVHDNVIVYTGSAARTGIAVDWNHDVFWRDSNNRLDYNRYYVPVVNNARWAWHETSPNWDGIRGMGQERNGQIFGYIPQSALQVPAWNPPNLIVPVYPPAVPPTATPTLEPTAAPTFVAQAPTTVAQVPTSTPLPPTQVPPVTSHRVTAFTLVNADTNADIKALANGETLNLAVLPRSLNIRVNTSGQVESVRLSLNGHQRVENGLPYTLWGDNNGDYEAWRPAVGSYTLSATSHSANDAGGTYSQTMTIRFTVTNVAPPRPSATPTPVPPPHRVVNFTLVNADTNADIKTLANGETLNLALLPRNLNIRVNITGPAESVRVALNGRSRTENAAPFTLWGDDGGNYEAWRPSVGSYTLDAISYSLDDARGAAAAPQAIRFTVVNQPVRPTSTPRVQPTSTPRVRATSTPRVPPTSTPRPTLVPTTAPNAANTVTSFTLVNADTGRDIKVLADGETLNLTRLPRNLNIRVNASGRVESIRITMNGRARTENGAPYTVWGDNRGRYEAWRPAAGSYTLSATAHTADDARGTGSAVRTVRFRVVTFVTPVDPLVPPATPTAVPTSVPPTSTPARALPGSITSFTLVNADTQQDIRILSNGSTVNLADLPTRNLNVRVNTNPGVVGSVKIGLNNSYRTESGAPYALWGDQNGRYLPWRPAAGSYTLSATAYTEANALGTAGQTLTIRFTFAGQTVAQPTATIARPTATVAPTSTPLPSATPTVINHSVTGFALVNADTDQDIHTLVNGETINLALLPTRNLNIRAITNPNVVGSVVMTLNGSPRTENGAPYSIWGDDNGNYYPWVPTVGTYTLTGQTFTNINAGGPASLLNVIQFAFVDQPAQYPLTVTVNGGGTVQVNPNQTAFAPGTTVQLVAVPNTGWLFSGWSGGAAGTQNTTSITITSSTIVTAHFVQEAPTSTPIPTATTAAPQPFGLPMSMSGDDGQGGGWAVTGGWAMTQANAYGGTGYSWLAAPTATDSVIALLNPIDLRTAVYPRLTFQSRLAATETAAVLQVSIDGTNWGVLLAANASADWAEVAYDLSAYRGYIIWLRWAWLPQTQTAGATSDTWMIDQIALSDTAPLPTATFVPTNTPEPTATLVPTSTPEPTATFAPTATPIVLQPLTLISVCAGTWQVDNLNAAAINYTWEIAGTGVRNGPLSAAPGSSTFATGALAGQPETIVIAFDLADGAGERTVTIASNMNACP